jgi:hypothetical protein
MNRLPLLSSSWIYFEIAHWYRVVEMAKVVHKGKVLPIVGEGALIWGRLGLRLTAVNRTISKHKLISKGSVKEQLNVFDASLIWSVPLIHCYLVDNCMQ